MATKKEELNKNRETWIDCMKIIAIYLVIILHTFGTEKSTIFYYLGTFSIPLFFMISGYLNIRKNRKYNYCLKKIFSIIKIIFIWNIIYIIINICLKKLIISPKLFILPFWSIIQNFFQYGYFFHFWFLGSLIIIYLILPLISKIFANEKAAKTAIIILMIMCIIWNLINIFINYKYNILVNNNIVQTLRIWTWLFYYCMGGYIYKNDLFSSISKKKHLFLMIFTIVITLIYEYKLSMKLYNSLWAENFYNSLLVMISSILIFTYLRKINLKNNKTISVIGTLVMGVYIIHPTIISMFKKLIITKNDLINLLISIVVFILCFFVSYFINKIPKLNKLIKL